MTDLCNSKIFVTKTKQFLPIIQEFNKSPTLQKAMKSSQIDRNQTSSFQQSMFVNSLLDSLQLQESQFQELLPHLQQAQEIALPFSSNQLDTSITKNSFINPFIVRKIKEKILVS